MKKLLAILFWAYRGKHKEVEKDLTQELDVFLKMD